MRAFETWTEYLLRYPRWITLAALGLLTVAGFGIASLRLDFSIDRVIRPDPESYRESQAFFEALPPPSYNMVCVLEWPEPIDWPQVEQLADFTKRLDALPLHEFRSLSNLTLLEYRGGLPWPTAFLTADRKESVADKVGRHPLIRGRLISHDLHSAAVLLTPRRDEAPGGLDADALYRQLESLKPSGTELRLIGSDRVNGSMLRHMRRDMARGVLLELLGALILLPLLLRTVRGTVLPLLVILVAMALFFGLVAWMQWAISILEIAVPGLIVIIALCDAVHMMHRFEEALHEGLPREDAIRAMMRQIGPACFHTSVTTGIGFLSLLIAQQPSIRDFGVLAFLGVIVAFLTVVGGLPLALYFWPLGNRKSKARSHRFWRWGYGRPRWTYAAFACLVFLSAWGAARATIDARWLDELPREDPAVRDLVWFEENFAGVLTFNVRIVGQLDRPQNLAAVRWLQAQLIREAGVTRAESPYDWIAEVLGNPTELDEAQIAQGVILLKAAGEQFPRHILSPDFRTGHLLMHTGDIGSRRFRRLVERVEELEQTLPADAELELKVLGINLEAHQASTKIVDIMLKSFGLTLVLISLLISFLFRSLRVGCIAIVPNVLPILVAVGLTGWLGIPLRIGIVMIFSLGIGLAVDDTIHLLSRFLQERKQAGRKPREALLASLRTTGNALLTTSLILVVGGLCYLPSAFRSMQDVGILLSTIVITALVADLWLLPLLLERFLPSRD